MTPLDAEKNISASRSYEAAKAKAEKIEIPTILGTKFISFSRGMSKKELKMNTFLLEGTFGFESYTLRERMTLVMRYSDKRVKEWFCDNGAEGALPDDWDSFKNDLIEFCADEGLESLHKFKEEKWSQFIKRVLEFSKSREIDETIILIYLRKIPAPRDYQTLFFTSDLPLKEIIERIKEWETVKDKKQTFQKNINREHKPKQVAGKKYKDVQVKCHKCNKTGHYANECTYIKPFKGKNMCNNQNDDDDVDRKIIKIDGSEYIAIFDTGSSVNLISQKFLHTIGKSSKTINTNKSISLIDGSKLILSKKLFLDIEYKSRKLNLEFYVLKKSIMDIVLGCAAINKFMLNSEFPISCPIITRGNQIISWTRPIMNFKKKKIFQELVENLESRGIIEPSTSLWCHPVVVVEKKDGNHRFTLDLTRLNNIVDLDRFT
ncbi:hypothetical protein DMUE_5764, partial [Dictyocoela muelleri]